MGERYAVLVKATAFCIVVWTIGELIVRTLGKISQIFGIDGAIIANAIGFVVLCLGGWLLLRYSDWERKNKK